MELAGKWLRFGRFSLVGVIGTVLQLLLLYVLIKCFHHPAVAAMPLAVEITVLHNFVWHERFTWRERHPRGMRDVIGRLWRFHATNGIISLGGNTLLIYVLAKGFKAPVLPSAIVAIGMCAVLNFLIADKWVYRVMKAARNPAC